MDREEKWAMAEVISDIAQRQNATNQTAPHSIYSSGKFEINISTVTTYESSLPMIVEDAEYYDHNSVGDGEEEEEEDDDEKDEGKDNEHYDELIKDSYDDEYNKIEASEYYDSNSI